MTVMQYGSEASSAGEGSGAVVKSTRGGAEDEEVEEGEEDEVGEEDEDEKEKEGKPTLMKTSSSDKSSKSTTSFRGEGEEARMVR